ncbi:MAG: hypothetical protein IBJ17_11750 [Reyranella sp.]|nr:hypothetical protein [Reyranella sp.]
MRAIAKILGGVAPLILSTGAFAQDWTPTKPVWDQADRLTCKETFRYYCKPTGQWQCLSRTGRANFRIDFRRNKVAWDDTAAGWDIKGRAFKAYPLMSPDKPAMSLLLSDGRLFKFLYKAKDQKGPYDLEARLLGYEDPGPEVTDFTCSRS